MPPDNNLSSESDRESVLSFKEMIPKPRRNSTGPKYFCSIPGCNEKFKRLDQLDRHDFHHTGLKKHACTYDDCYKVYTILTHLKRHIRTTHERLEKVENNVPCTIEDCDKMFQSLCNMHRHVREVHENPKVYPCVYCEEKFTQNLKLRRHEITKHTHEYPFNCDKCSKGFYQQWQYEKHRPSCKVYYCPNCSEQFDKWTMYLKHCKEKQHGRKYYKCDHCTRIYAKPGQLQHHIMAQHVDEDLAMNFKCTYDGCERVYAYERNLRQHVKTAHSGKRFECQEKECKRCFSSAQNLAKHVKREHTLQKEENKSFSNESNPPIENKKSQRKKRKDAGVPALSNLACLSGIAVGRQFDKLLRLRESDALAAVSAELHAKTITDEDVCSETEFIPPKKLCSSTIHFISSDLPKKAPDLTYMKTDEGELSDMLALVLQE